MSLSRRTVVRHVDMMASDTKETLAGFQEFLIALDESTDLSDTAQPVSCFYTRC